MFQQVKQLLEFDCMPSQRDIWFRVTALVDIACGFAMSLNRTDGYDGAGNTVMIDCPPWMAQDLESGLLMSRNLPAYSFEVTEKIQVTSLNGDISTIDSKIHTGFIVR